MLNLLRFFAKNSPFFTWLLLAVLSLCLLLQGNPYQRSVWLGSANVLTGGVYHSISGVTGYFGLRSVNDVLLERMGQMEAENANLRRQLAFCLDSLAVKADTLTEFEYRIAHVVSNSINQAENYITIDRGSRDGIEVGMGVSAQNGVVGLVSQVGSRYSLVISLLNPNTRLSVCLKDDESFGYLNWTGTDVDRATVVDLPRNARIAPGDTIVTTGFAASFPKGIPVGKVVEVADVSNSNFLSCEVELFADFGKLNAVNVIINHQRDERTF